MRMRHNLGRESGPDLKDGLEKFRRGDEGGATKEGAGRDWGGAEGEIGVGTARRRAARNGVISCIREHAQTAVAFLIRKRRLSVGCPVEFSILK